MRIAKLLICFIVMASGYAFGAELDTYYLQQFGELPQAAKSLLKSPQAKTVHKCGMPLKHDLKRDWQKLADDTRKTLAKYLEKPVLAGERVMTSTGGHFRIHYATSGADAPPPADNNANSIPDWIETVAATFETVYTREITQMGYSVPPVAPYNVYLQNMYYFGLTDSDILTGQSATSYITIENDFAEEGFQASIPGNDTPYNTSVKALQITAAHEFHHVIQFGINYYFEPWYSEATSSWIEDEVYDTVNQLYSYADDYFANTAASLNAGDGYSRWIFNRSLFEQFYPQDIVWKIWEDFAAELAPPSGADIPMLPFIDKVLKSQRGSLAASFFSFAKQVYLRDWSSHTDEIANFSAVSAIPVSADTFYAVPSPNLPEYSFTYYKISHQTNSTTPLTISYPDKSAYFQVVAFKDSDKTEYPYNAATQTITIPVFAAGDSIYLLVCNSTPIPVSGGGSGGSGGGGGGGCFIATAAYGSSLHPDVMTLRHFRDNYLVTNAPGRAFVTAYYRISPPIAAFIAKHEFARTVVRLLLTPIIFAVKQSGLLLAATVVLALAAFAGRRKILTRTGSPVQ